MHLSVDSVRENENSLDFPENTTLFLVIYSLKLASHARLQSFSVIYRLLFP